jgi:ectoine hydroxylase-related dioxygenase (phytanoyl-CoA dioxygenase family)
MPLIENEVAEAIDAYGYAVLRQLLRPADISLIFNAAKAFFDFAEQRRLDPGHRFPRAYLFNPGNMATSMAALDDFGTANYQLLHMVANSSAARCLRHFLGDDVICSLMHSRMRKSYPQAVPAQLRPSTVAWHADADDTVGYYGAFILWVPFTPCNEIYPGLDFKHPDGKVVRIDLALGDALFFPSTTPHRTADCPTSTMARYSCDMRFFKAADIPHRVHPKVGQDALLSVRAFASESW